MQGAVFVEAVRVGEEQCRKIGELLQKFSIRSSVYKREYFSFPADVETKLRVFLFSIAICHQTHTLIHRKLNLVGFNFLEKVFVDLAKTGSELLEPAFVAGQTVPSLCAKLAPQFSESNQCTLDRLEERAELLIDMSQTLLSRYEGQISNLFAQSQGYLGGKQGVYRLLSDFKAYADPLKKKSSLLIAFASTTQLFQIQDWEHFVPVMDYHVQRVLLRFGCVEVLDPALRLKLQNQAPLDSDEPVRSASIEAVKRLSFYSGHSDMGVHDFLWPLGRSCCKENPLCQSGRCDKTPCTFEQFVALPSHNHCLFEGVCKGSRDEDTRKLWQPVVETHFY